LPIDLLVEQLIAKRLLIKHLLNDHVKLAGESTRLAMGDFRYVLHALKVGVRYLLATTLVVLMRLGRSMIDPWQITEAQAAESICEQAGTTH
jgi:hypothetical protein